MSIATLIITQLQNDWFSVFIVLLATYVCYFYYKYYTRKNPLPGVIPLPFVGNLLHTGWDLPRWANKAQARFGDVWEVWVGNERSIFLGNASLIDKVYTSSTKNNFTLRTLENSGHVEYGLSDKGIILNRVSWQYNRQLLTQCVTSQKYYRDFVATTQKSFEEVENYWMRLGKGTPLDFAAWTMRMVTDVTVLMSTGKPAYQCAIYYNQLVKSPAERIEHPKSVFKSKGDFVSSITQWFYMVQFSYFFPTWVRHYVPGFSWYNEKCRKNSEWMSSTLMNIIEERKEEIKATPLDQPLSSDILTVLLTTNTERDMNKISSKHGFDRPMTDAEIAENLTEVFAAGIDTTANSLTFMFYNICKYPHVKARLLDEINSVFGEGPITRQIIPEELDKLAYIDAFIKETARTTPVVPLLVKTASTDDTVVGLQWKAGTQFYANVHGIHMNASSWDQPNEFDPDRFLKKEPEKYSLLQFGGGLRICPGRQMAIYELKCLLVLLLKRYDLELKNKSESLKYSFGMIHHCDNLDVYLNRKVC